VTEDEITIRLNKLQASLFVINPYNPISRCPFVELIRLLETEQKRELAASRNVGFGALTAVLRDEEFYLLGCDAV
jgi:hypothetical protein